MKISKYELTETRIRPPTSKTWPDSSRWIRKSWTNLGTILRCVEFRRSSYLCDKVTAPCCPPSRWCTFVIKLHKTEEQRKKVVTNTCYTPKSQKIIRTLEPFRLASSTRLQETIISLINFFCTPRSSYAFDIRRTLLRSSKFTITILETEKTDGG